MLFNSYIFILLFLPLTVAGFYLLSKTGKNFLPKMWLLGMSLWFYAYFNIRYLPIIVASILINFLIYKLFFILDKKIIRNLLLTVGLIFNIGILFYYKYLDFCIENINIVFGLSMPLQKLLLPLGISFFTFQQVSFVVDSYKGTVPKYSLLDYSLFVTFFPQLIAGPVVLHSEIIPQFADQKSYHINCENIAKGFMAFSFGIAKKVLIADVFGQLVDIGFSDISSLNSSSAILCMLAYTMQIYFDFSGYCDMAIGLGLFFNIKIPINFMSPYRALDMDDFWKRWHITLTRFLRTNIYYPLGGSRKGKVRTYLNIFIVFLVSGIWHGANWTFILWGVLNGIAVMICKMGSGILAKLRKRVPFLLWIITFALINMAWVLFRADSISDAAFMLQKIFEFNFAGVPQKFYDVFQTAEFSQITWILSKFSQQAADIFTKLFCYAFFGFAVFASVRMKNTSEKLDSFRPKIYQSLICAFLLVWSILSLSGVSTFLYFNF